MPISRRGRNGVHLPLQQLHQGVVSGNHTLRSVAPPSFSGLPVLPRRPRTTAPEGGYIAPLYIDDQKSIYQAEAILLCYRNQTSCIYHGDKVWINHTSTCLLMFELYAM